MQGLVGGGQGLEWGSGDGALGRENGVAVLVKGNDGDQSGE